MRRPPHSIPHRTGIRLLARTIAGSAIIGALTLPGTASSASTTAAAGEEPVPGAVWPLDPHPVVAPFDPPGCAYCAGHRGVDLGTLPLQPVRAAISGTVTFAGDLAGRGVVVIDDGNHRVTYEPVVASMRKGAQVTAGEVIGMTELVGSHCYPQACLHLGLIDDITDEYLDPLSLFETPGVVRLLPLWHDEPFLFGLDLTALF